VDDVQTEEIKRHFEVIAESLKDEIKLVAEGQESIRKDIKTFAGEMMDGFKETKATIEFKRIRL